MINVPNSGEILGRSPTRTTYARRVALAAVLLALRRYITAEDAEALIVVHESLPAGSARALGH